MLLDIKTSFASFLKINKGSVTNEQRNASTESLPEVVIIVDFFVALP